MGYIGKKPTDAPLTSSDIADGIISTADLANTAVTGAKVNTDVISAQTALTAEPADTDEFLVSDAGVIKRIDYSLIKGGGTHVKIATATVSGSTASIDLTGMDSTYQNYMVEINNVHQSSDNVQLRFRFIQGGSTVTSDIYDAQVQRFGIAEGNTFLSKTENGNYLLLSIGTDQVNDPQLNGRMFIYNAPVTDAHTSYTSDISHQHYDNHDHQRCLGHGEIENNTASTGITFFFSSGNIIGGTFRLYGIL